MKKIHLYILLIIVVLFILPTVVTKYKESKAVPTSSIAAKNSEETKTNDEECDIQISIQGKGKKYSLEEYLVGVVAAEMPASFNLEALKAQAIASRTFALKRTNFGENAIEPNVSAQAFADEDQRRKDWGTSFEKNEKKIRKAVQGTKGQVLVYKDELITAMFFSTSNGHTESAKSYSGQSIPYLQSVSVPSNEKESPRYHTNYSFTLQQWNSIFNEQWTKEQIQNVKIYRNNSGRVETIKTGDYKWSGREVREKLQLASTDFIIKWNANKKMIQVTTTGYGHGVGMSQYGAKALAEKGANAKEILHHFYQQVKIEKLKKSSSLCLNSQAIDNNSK
ncbi:stage II sporulation protein D [Rummeliibacillus pycnus]|uniref:stage II sporulation protein D n=1 Tax=Rummeliibacillus pycnus TaxID=101070 RepID=UPI000C9D248C|nr:stage II sporulation protein D [Rummeliibacillus pycnus]